MLEVIADPTSRRWSPLASALTVPKSEF